MNAPAPRCFVPWCLSPALQALAMGAVLLAACSPQTYDGSLLREAAALGENQQWNEARPLIQEHLLKHPADPLAHYYYGLSYLHLAEPQLTLAEGELLTAQQLLAATEALPSVELEEDLAEFKGKLFQKTALVYMRAFRESIRLNAPYEYSRDLLKKALVQTELGLKADPGSQALKEYLEFLKETLHGTPERTPDIMTRAAETGSSI